MLNFDDLEDVHIEDEIKPKIDLSKIPHPTPKGIIELKRLFSAIRKGVDSEYVINRKIIDEMYIKF